MAVLLLITMALANDGPPPRLWAEVAGQGVQLQLALYASGEPGLDARYDLVRLDADAAVAETLLADQAFAESDAVGSTALCRVWDDEPEADCAATPEVCRDCDGDGVAECAPNGVCLDGLLFAVADDCVEPGTWSWELREHGEDYGSDAQATVADQGQDCAAGGGDTADTAACADAACADGQCQGCASGAEAGIGAAMLGLGLLAWRRR